MVAHGILNEARRKDKVTERKEETDRQEERREMRERGGEKKKKGGKDTEIVPILSWKQGVAEVHSSENTVITQDIEQRDADCAKL